MFCVQEATTAAEATSYRSDCIPYQNEQHSTHAQPGDDRPWALPPHLPPQPHCTQVPSPGHSLAPGQGPASVRRDDCAESQVPVSGDRGPARRLHCPRTAAHAASSDISQRRYALSTFFFEGLRWCVLSPLLCNHLNSALVASKQSLPLPFFQS